MQLKKKKRKKQKQENLIVSRLPAALIFIIVFITSFFKEKSRACRVVCAPRTWTVDILQQELLRRGLLKKLFRKKKKKKNTIPRNLCLGLGRAKPTHTHNARSSNEEEITIPVSFI